jgi:hypothetical protein
VIKKAIAKRLSLAKISLTVGLRNVFGLLLSRIIPNLAFCKIFSGSLPIIQRCATLRKRINSVTGFVFSDRLFAFSLDRLLSEI